MQCWEYGPVQRPTFYDLVQSISQQLQAIAEYHNIGATSESLDSNSTNNVSILESKFKVDTPLQNESSSPQEISAPNSRNLISSVLPANAETHL